MRQIQSLLDAQVSCNGKISGAYYEWDRAGDVILVDDADVPDLLSKRLGNKLCCGEHPELGNKVFQEIMVEE